MPWQTRLIDKMAVNPGVLVYCLWLCGGFLTLASGFRLSEQRRQESHASPAEELPALEQQFYYPTEEGIKDFQQILLRGLGLTAVPDLSKVILFPLFRFCRLKFHPILPLPPCYPPCYPPVPAAWK